MLKEEEEESYCRYFYLNVTPCTALTATCLGTLRSRTAESTSARQHYTQYGLEKEKLLISPDH